MRLPKQVAEDITSAGVVVLATASKEGMPNVVYVGYKKLLDDGRLVLADNYFAKTKANIESNPKISVAFRSETKGSFQVKGTCRRLAEGPEYEDMLTWVDERHPRAAAVVLDIEEVYNGAEKLA